MTIVTESVKLRYNCPLMVMCAYGDIFQAKVDKLVGDIEGIKIYINDILVLSKYYFKNHLYRPSIVFGKVRAAGLIVNAPK